MKEGSNSNDICDYNCSDKINLKRHIRFVHERKKPFQCEICEYNCFLKNDLKRQIESIHEGNPS